MGTYLLLYRHCTAQVNGKLTDIDEGMLVRRMCVQGIHLCQRALHEVDHGQDIGRGESGILHKCDVHLLCRKEDKIQPHRTEQKYSFTNIPHPGLSKPGMKYSFYKISHFKGICKNNNPACSFFRGDERVSLAQCLEMPLPLLLCKKGTAGWLWAIHALSWSQFSFCNTGT